MKHATYGSLVGDEAVFKVLRWTGGNFELNFEGMTDQETTKLNTQGLLMEGICGCSTNRSGMAASRRRKKVAQVARVPAPVEFRVRVALPAPHRVAVPAAARRKRKKMSSSTVEAPEAMTAAVITVSDTRSRGEGADLSGPAVAEALKKLGFRVVATQIVQDDSMQIQNALVHHALEVRLIVTTGGTGIAPRDVTPEATEAICDRLIDGVGERMRMEGAKKKKLRSPR